MKREYRMSITIIIILMLLIFSGCQDKGLDKKEIIISDLEEDVITEQDDLNDLPNRNEDKVNSDAISYILHSSEEFYLESLVGSKNLVSLSPENRSKILDYFNNIKLTKDNSDIENSLEEKNFSFVLHIKNKGVSLYIGNEFILMEDGKGYSKYYLEEGQIEKLNNLLEKMYLENINKYIKSFSPSEIQVAAVDTAQNTVIKDKEEIIKIIDSIKLTEILPNRDLINTLIQYPYSKIDIKSDTKNISIIIVKDNSIRLEVLGEISYFKTENNMAKMVDKYLDLDNQVEKDIFERTFKASKLKVEVFDGQVLEYNDSSYIIQIARSLKAKIKEDSKPDKLFESKKIKLSVYIDNKVEVIEVYDDYIKYGEDIYYKMLVGEEIINIIKSKSSED